MNNLRDNLTAGLAVLIVAAAFGGFIVANYLWGDEGRSRPFSSYGTIPEGSKAFYLLLKEGGLTVRRWEKPIISLEQAGEKQALFMVDPGVRQITGEEAASLKHWVEEGNRLILLGADQPRVREVFNLDVESAQFFAREVAVAPETGHPLFDGVKVLSFNRGLSFSDGTGGIPLVEKEGRTFVLWKEAGPGEIIVVSDPEIITNKYIERDDNLIFLLNAVNAFDRPMAVLFNEYQHGFGEEAVSAAPGQGRLFPSLAWPSLQLGLFTVLILMTMGKRFSAPRPFPAPSRRVLDDMVTPAASIYRRANAKKLVFDLLYSGLKRRITLKYRLRHNPNMAELVNLGERVTGIERKELEADFTRFEKALQKGSLPAAELFALSRRIDRYRKEFNL